MLPWHAGATDQLANCEVGPRVHVLEGGSSVDDVRCQPTGQPHRTKGLAVLSKRQGAPWPIVCSQVADCLGMDGYS